MSDATTENEISLAAMLEVERVLASMEATEHFPAIEELVGHLVAIGSLEEAVQEPILEALRDREDQRSTGIGNGVAIPHCFSEDVEKVTAIFGRSEDGIDFCALDRAPVHFVVLFIVPKSQYALHLKTLAAIAKILNSAETRESLAEAPDSEAIYEILSTKSA